MDPETNPLPKEDAAPEYDAPLGIPPEDLLQRALQSKASSGATLAWSPPNPDELARLLPQYQIESFLGRGGMGAVYKGRQTALDRPVAIKLLPAEVAADGSFIARFQREARTLARLQHPGIVAVYDFGQTGEGHLYFVMEFVDGTDLHRVLRGPGLSEEQSLEIVSQVCDALQYAHSQGVVHRDIKPANVLLTGDGRAKLADFGLARPLHEESAALTLSNVVMGTPDYIAPEQLYGAADHRADLFSLGVMLYEMLTGRPPRGCWLAPSQRVQVDVRLDDVVVRALAEDPELRYQQASEIKTDVDYIRTTVLEEPAPAHPADEAPVAAPERAAPMARPRTAKVPPKAKPGAWLAGALVVLAGLAAVFLMSDRTPTAEPPEATPPALGAEVGGGAKEGTRNEASEVAPAASAPAKAAPGPLSPAYIAATKDSPFTNSLGMKFVPVPGTDVLVCIHETRYRDFETYAAEIGAGGWWRDQSIYGYEITERPGDHPVIRTSWEDAQAFCAWLSRKEGRTYRLPTDEEWSLAAGLGGKEVRSSSDTPESLSAKVTGEYPWGTSWPVPAGAGNYSDQSRKVKAPNTDPTERAGYIDDYDDGFPTTAPVMSFRANRFGIYDLGGNAWEWVEDWFNEEREHRVVRGGSCTDLGVDIQRSLLSSFRHRLPPDARHTGRGFRVVLVPDHTAASAAARAATTVSPPPASAAPIENTIAATKDAPFTNSLGMKFVPVPGTEVLFCIHETRIGDFEVFAKENPNLDATWRTIGTDGYAITDSFEQHPVKSVSWNDAKAFCEWLAKKEGRAYRLPTDREWSIAAGLGGKEEWTPGTTPEILDKRSAGEFPWGSEWPPPPGAGNFSDRSRRKDAPRQGATYIENYDDGFPFLAPVMTFAPNTFGLHDMSGNVWEWTEDRFSEAGEKRVIRGASWQQDRPDHLRLSKRGSPNPDDRNSSHGFRVVLVPDAGPTQTSERAAAPASPRPPETSTVAAMATKDQPFTNSLGMKFVPVPETGVLFCAHETRWSDFKSFAQAVGNASGDSWIRQEVDGYVPEERLDDLPVMFVSRENAEMFCEWLSKTEGRSYRLPTDHEWSVAVGIGQLEEIDATPESKSGKLPSVYPWGKDYPPSAKVGNFSDLSRKSRAPRSGAGYIETYDDGFPTIAPVMSFPPNDFGIYDLGGNMREWVAGEYAPGGGQGILRDSSFQDHRLSLLQSASRRAFDPALGNSDTGFRVVLEGVRNTHAPKEANILAKVGETTETSMPPTPSELNSAGQLLFADGTLGGWTGDLAGYSLRDGVLLASEKAGDLVSPEEYGSFHLKFELRLSPGANSGIGVWCAKEKGAFGFLTHTGFEIQLLDDTDPAFASAKPWQLHGSLYNFLAPKAKAMGPPGSWNRHEIRVEGTRLVVVVNDVTVLDEELPTGDPAEGSRQPRIDFSTKRGHLVICGSSGPVEFRNLSIRTLDAPSGTDPRLAELRAAYETAYRNEVGLAHEAAVADLDAKYLAALDRALAAETQAGRLGGALALREEKQRVESGAELPADDGAAAPALQPLRQTYRAALSDLERQRDQLAAPVRARYRQSLEAYQNELTRSGDLDGAVEIRRVIETLEQARIPASAPPKAPRGQQSSPPAASTKSPLHPIFSEGILGHAVNDPKHLRDFPKNANLVLDHGWPDRGDEIIRHARDRGLKVVMMFRNDILADAKSAGIQLAAANEDVVLGMGWTHPNYDRVPAEAVEEFGKMLKEASAGLQFWGFYVDRPRGRAPEPVPPAIDILVVAYFYAGDPASLREKFASVNSTWIRFAQGRPALAQWNSWTTQGAGLVPTVAEGTMKTLREQTDAHGMAGLLIGHFGELHAPLAGLETNRNLLREIEKLERKPSTNSQ